MNYFRSWPSYGFVQKEEELLAHGDGWGIHLDQVISARSGLGTQLVDRLVLFAGMVMPLLSHRSAEKID